MPGPAVTDIVHLPPAPPGGGGSGGGGGRGDWGAPRRASLAGLVVLLAATTMVFGSLVGAYILSRMAAREWLPTPLPRLLWANSLVLLASSGMIEAARARLAGGRRHDFNGWWTGGAVLGLLFLAGQAVAWRQLREAGVYVAANPSSGFFYVLTAAHAVHLFGAALALVYLAVRALQYQLGPARRTAVEVAALFWHFLAGLWVCLLFLFSALG